MQVAAAVGAGLKVGGHILGGIAAKKAGDQNRAALYGQALEEEKAGNAQALRIRDQVRKIIGEQTAAQGANGFTGDSGSALDALTESQINATMDMMQVRRDAMFKATAMRAEGDMRAQQSRYAMWGSFINAAQAAIGAGSDWGAASGGQLPKSRGG